MTSPNADSRALMDAVRAVLDEWDRDHDLYPEHRIRLLDKPMFALAMALGGTSPNGSEVTFDPDGIAYGLGAP